MWKQNSDRLEAKEGKWKNRVDEENPFTSNCHVTGEKRLQLSVSNAEIDSKFGFSRCKDSCERVGWLFNMHPTEVLDADRRLVSAMDYYFIQEDGGRFKTTIVFRPYFYLVTKPGYENETATFLKRRYTGGIHNIVMLHKEDLDLPNHLVGLKRTCLKLSFLSITDLLKVRNEIMPSVRKKKRRQQSSDVLASEFLNNVEPNTTSKKFTDHFDNVIDIREYDVPYHVRVSIDLKIFVGHWYSVRNNEPNNPVINKREDLIDWPDITVLAYDIETTKPPLKFPDPAIDQIMMISYMIDGQGFLITNREIVSADVDDFEYTPKPEFEGSFTVYNEPNEMAVLQKFFDHIYIVKPHVFVTYNGDMFDWPFVEARAAFHQLDMSREIGFSCNKEGDYLSRPSVHMDCLKWVKRDSYLPVGSQNLKAVAKAKLRYNPVELDPEDMCRLAIEQPQVLSNYSVSDAVATYYLYMQYVHPFIFALCTILPMEPDEVLRKGSGTLCEALLMVEAYHVNILFPNKQETVLNKMTEDGHVLDEETYVGGHVEALESGVFRADIPCRFRMVPDAFQQLIDRVRCTMEHAIVEEEKLSMSEVVNFGEVCSEIESKLAALRDRPSRLELPIIYHLDVGAMYPNIILTNRLQPSAMVNEVNCAACDFNKLDASCQRSMPWTWRGQFMPASRGEFSRIQQQLELEKFPPRFKGDRPRAFHHLPREEQAAVEKQRLVEYCRKAYKKIHMTKVEVRQQTVCQRENSFYVDTVRSFRDRRYQFKALHKATKGQLADAIAKNDVVAAKSAKNKEVLYDSLQLAHKCILNSFYGYVMRKGARWYSMEMAGIVCHTGASIITRARELIEQIGRPLELDTDGIWCILPASFPENFVIKTNNPKKPQIKVSYPGAMLNVMVKDHYTNDQYQELVDPETLTYSQRSENSIFFEVDGPYLAMVLPASKDEGKKLKKRYAVFNFDKSLAELKGFEVKRRGELQLIKIFQSSVFDAFLRGKTLEECYAEVAKVADYWLDVLYSKAENMPDSELFELISENRSMSRKLEEYGSQKSTSIKTAQRLAEFLGDQMVKDAGLSCRFIISHKPDGAPVTERAIPLAIFQAEPFVRRHYLKKWLKLPSMDNFDIRNVLDWNYYIERLGSAIQKIITIPAALQGVLNPVPRVLHPDWLHKRLLEKSDVLKQKRIDEIFTKDAKPVSVPSDDSNADDDHGLIGDIEDTLLPRHSKSAVIIPVTNKRRRLAFESQDVDTCSSAEVSWRVALGPSPICGTSQDEFRSWLSYQKKKWDFQINQRKAKERKDGTNKSKLSVGRTMGLGGFLRKTQRNLLNTPWEIIQLIETSHPGIFRLWALVGNELHCVKLSIHRIFYINQRTAKESVGDFWKKANRFLPRTHPVFNLYEYSISEDVYREHYIELMAYLSTAEIEGIYETQVPLEFRGLLQLGCVCMVARDCVGKLSSTDLDSFDLSQLEFKSLAQCDYLVQNNLKYIYLYHFSCGHKSMFGLFFPISKKVVVFVVDTVRTNQLPNMTVLFNKERKKVLSTKSDAILPDADHTFEITTLTNVTMVYRSLQRHLQYYKDEKHGPTMIAVQSLHDVKHLVWLMPGLADFPMVTIHAADNDNLYNVLDWQRVGAAAMINHYLNVETLLSTMTEQCRYFHVPLGNLPQDATIFGADLFYARMLKKNNYVLWCSQTERPDLGGKEVDDNRLFAEFDDIVAVELNNPGAYHTICIDLNVDGLAINALLQAHHIHELEGSCSAVAFSARPNPSLEEMMSDPGAASSVIGYDDTAQCSGAIRVLRLLVQNWLREVSHFDNVFADFQIIHFYRWLSSTQSLLYEPALKRALHSLMKKLFLQLMAEFRKLGATIVHANFSKVILATNKHSVMDALVYTDFIVNNIRSKEIFKAVDMVYRQCWEYLLWLDPANFGGIKGELPKGVAHPMNESVTSHDSQNRERLRHNESETNESLVLFGGDDPDNPLVEMRWNLSVLLPDAANSQTKFMSFVAGYITKVFDRLKEERGDFTPGNTPVRRRVNRSQNVTSSFIKDSASIDKKMESFCQDFVTKQTQNLLELTDGIRKKAPWVEKGGATFPYIVGTMAKTYNPSLEFIKAVCKVLSLDEAISDEVISLRRTLLKLIGVPEFSDQATWQDPCVSFVLFEVICKACNHCRDIDLCKDPHLGTDPNGLPAWLCPTCKCSYLSADIEAMLIDNVKRRSMALVLQDTLCVKCHQVKADNMSVHCGCGGSYASQVDNRQFTKKITIFKEIARHFRMPLLEEIVDFIVNMNPSFKHIS